MASLKSLIADEKLIHSKMKKVTTRINTPVIPEIFYRGSIDSSKEQSMRRIAQFIDRFSIQALENDGAGKYDFT